MPSRSATAALVSRRLACAPCRWPSTIDSPAVPPRPQFALTGEYPLARFLWIAVNYKPGSQLDPLRREFVKYVYSAAGQSDVVKDGYFPVTPQIAAKALASVGLE